MIDDEALPAPVARRGLAACAGLAVFEDVMAAADASWLVQLEIVQPGAAALQDRQTADRHEPYADTLFTIAAAHTRDDSQLVAEGRWRDDGTVSAEQAHATLQTLRSALCLPIQRPPGGRPP